MTEPSAWAAIEARRLVTDELKKRGVLSEMVPVGALLNFTERVARKLSDAEERGAQHGFQNGLRAGERRLNSRRVTGWRRDAWALHSVRAGTRRGTDEDARLCALALAGEVGKLCEAIGKEWEGDWAGAPGDLSERIEAEAAAVAVCLYVFTKALGVNLEAATERRLREVVSQQDPETRAAMDAFEDPVDEVDGGI